MSRIIAILIAASLCALGYFYFTAAQERVVVYCALDREFAEEILNDFEQKSGIKVVVRWDTEANKSVGLYQDLIRERDRPRCDVHWNNEILATIRLHRQGLLEPYKSPAATTFLAAFKADDGAWTGFASRARVLIVNKELTEKTGYPRRIEELVDPKWKGRFAMARPQFGTTATQAACLFALWGGDQAKAFYRKLKENEVLILPGNKQVAEAVGDGKIAMGLTDTDDAFEELDAHKSVEIVVLDFEGGAGKVNCPQLIPNTVAVIKGCPNPESARKLVDYLLTPEVEEKLAKAQSRQLPLNPKGDTKPHWPKGTLEFINRPGLVWLDFGIAADRWDEAQGFLATLFAPR
ncbi:MAG: extracellular solute-binding protein [Planctomycetes bacterium]|nr:extracellular solute-binding protein [Planctomycetota bacterium]